MPQRTRDARQRASKNLLLVCSLSIAASLAVWLFAFFPLMGNDYKFWVPLIYEGRVAWSSFGTLDYDFSPLRCLGLPAFASPNSLIFSIEHALSLLGNDLFALTAGIAAVFAFAFLGALQLFRRFGLPERAALLMATGWCLQGWACARVVAGHLPFIQFLLAPWLLSVLIRGRARWPELLAAAFWLSHMLYSGAFYSFLISSLGIGLCLLVLAHPLAAPLGRPDWRDVLRKTGTIAGLVVAMVAAKLLAVLDFQALFPREARLVQVPFWKSLLFAASNLAIPLPVPYGSLVGWPFGNWESYQFLYPGLFFVLLVMAWQLPTRRRRALGTLLALLLVGSALFTSGLLAGLFAKLPVLASLHVNPRWNAAILLPLVVLACVVIVGTGFLEAGRDRVGFWVLLALFVFAPLQFLDRIDMRIGYLYHDEVHESEGRVDFCYEPSFGYGLEHFPEDPRRIDWLHDELRDPRCLLASHACKPGSRFERPEDRAQLERYVLRDVHASSLRRPSLLLYLTGGFAALFCLIALVRDAWSGASARSDSA